jgi:hypothetical protein
MSLRLLFPTWKILPFLSFVVVVSSCGGGDSPTPSVPVTPSPTRWRIEGTVTESVTRKPLENVRLEILDGPNAGRLTATDKNGAYAFWDVAQAGFTLKVLGAGYAPVLKAVTLTSDTKLDFALAHDVAQVRLYMEPSPIRIGESGKTDYPNQLRFSLYVQETNFVGVTVEEVFYQLSSSARPLTWTLDNAWLRENYTSLDVRGGTWSSFPIRLNFDGEREDGTLTAVVDLVDAQGVTYRATATAPVAK